ncbi:MAG: hypothetical protein JNM56_08615 [Planctomycetia bacterium]|nr:hypothetical protein [Planctomycetia bacterium]
MTSSPHRPLLACALLTVLLAGCLKEEEIRRYTAPKPVTIKLKTPDLPPARLLAAIFPRGEGAWVFKVQGPEASVAKHEEGFEKFLQTVRLTDNADEPISWQLPEGWTREPGNNFRFATLRIAAKDDNLDLSVSKIQGADAASIRANVDRWAKQLGLPGATEADLKTFCTPIKVDGVEATLVKISGFSAGGDMGMGKGKPPPPVTPKAKPNPKVTFKAPDNWKEFEDGRGFSVASFKVTEGGQTAEITATPLVGNAGGIVANVSRWRDQVRLPPADEAEVRKAIREITINNKPAFAVDLLGPEMPGATRERIIGIILPQDRLTWFFKVRGGADLVDKQQAALQAFAESIKLTGANDG